MREVKVREGVDDIISISFLHTNKSKTHIFSEVFGVTREEAKELYKQLGEVLK